MNVLIINSVFPPDADVGTFRAAKFAKYLTEFGCEVHVLTKENKKAEMRTLIDDIEPVENVVRTSVMSDRIPFEKDLRWIKPMISKAVEIIDENDIDVVLHSAPARLPLFGCGRIKKQTGVPYIVDLRDPLSMNHTQKSPVNLRSRVFHKLTEILEPRVLRCASAVILNNDRMYDMYAKEYPSLTKKMLSINNGYDPEDYKGIEPTPVERFQMIFPGNFRDDMRWFFEPFSRFVDDRPDVLFTHFGRKDQNNAVKVRSVVEEMDLEKYVSFEGYVERRKVFSAAMGADLGIAVGIPGDELCIPTKIYDYIGCDIPVLGADDGVSAMRDVLSGFPNAYTLERSDEEAVYDTLVSVYENQPSSLGNPEEAEKYMRRNLTRELYELMLSEVERSEAGSC